MVEGSFGDLQVVENVLNRQPLVSLGQDQPLCGIEDFITPRGMLGNVDRSGHQNLILKPTVGLFIQSESPPAINQEAGSCSSRASLESCGLAVATRIAHREIAALEAPNRLAAPELVVVVHSDKAVPAQSQIVER